MKHREQNPYSNIETAVRRLPRIVTLFDRAEESVRAPMRVDDGTHLLRTALDIAVATTMFEPRKIVSAPLEVRNAMEREVVRFAEDKPLGTARVLAILQTAKSVPSSNGKLP